MLGLLFVCSFSKCITKLQESGYSKYGKKLNFGFNYAQNVFLFTGKFRSFIFIVITHKKKTKMFIRRAFNSFILNKMYNEQSNDQPIHCWSDEDTTKEHRKKKQEAKENNHQRAKGQNTFGFDFIFSTLSQSHQTLNFIFKQKCAATHSIRWRVDRAAL